MTRVFRFTEADPWTAQIFAAKSHVVRRSVASVEREMGREALELEVRKPGFHMIETKGQFVIICDPQPIRMIC